MNFKDYKIGVYLRTAQKDDEAIDEAFIKTKFNLVYTLIDDYMADVEWDKADAKELVIH